MFIALKGSRDWIEFGKVRQRRVERRKATSVIGESFTFVASFPYAQTLGNALGLESLDSRAMLIQN